MNRRLLINVIGGRKMEPRTAAHAAARTWWSAPRRLPVDDVYSAWFSAHSRCTQALRAWNAAAPPARTAAYRAYVAELEVEEAAARTLELLRSEIAAA
jgi:hypothetical protein